MLLTAAILFGSTRACSVVTDVRTTFYGAPDNDPPGPATAYACGGRNYTAGGIGTYANPLTFASAPGEYNTCKYFSLNHLPEIPLSRSKRNWNAFIHSDIYIPCGLLNTGEIVYFPYLKKYLRLEDYCAECTADYNTTGYKHIDVWTGGSATINNQSQIDCEDALTPDANQTVIRNPARNLAVNSGALWDGRSCHTARTYLNYTASTYCKDPGATGIGNGSGSGNSTTLACQTGCSWVGHCIGKSELSSLSNQERKRRRKPMCKLMLTVFLDRLCLYYFQ